MSDVIFFQLLEKVLKLSNKEQPWKKKSIINLAPYHPQHRGAWSAQSLMSSLSEVRGEWSKKQKPRGDIRSDVGVCNARTQSFVPMDQ